MLILNSDNCPLLKLCRQNQQEHPPEINHQRSQICKISNRNKHNLRSTNSVIQKNMKSWLVLFNYYLVVFCS